MDDRQILGRIRSMVETERDLRDQLAKGTISGEEEKVLLQDLEVELDRCWDLLRQRRALRDADDDPHKAATRPAHEVEGYRQ